MFGVRAEYRLDSWPLPPHSGDVRMRRHDAGSLVQRLALLFLAVITIH